MYRTKGKENNRMVIVLWSNDLKFFFIIMHHAFGKDAKCVMIQWDNQKLSNQAASCLV